MMIGMVRKVRASRMAYHAREDDKAEDEIIDHSFYGKIGFSRVSPEAYLAAFKANLGVGSREQGVEEEATSECPRLTKLPVSAATRSSPLTCQRTGGGSLLKHFKATLERSAKSKRTPRQTKLRLRLRRQKGPRARPPRQKDEQ